MSRNDFEDLYAYNRWANEITRQSVSKISVEQSERDLKASFPNIRTTLEHLIMAEWIWFERIKGESPTAPFHGETFPNMESLFQFWSKVEKNYESYIAQISAQEIARNVEYKNLALVGYNQSIAQILTHVVNHGTYHRGQIAAFLRQVGAEAQSTDMIFFDK